MSFLRHAVMGLRDRLCAAPCAQTAVARLFASHAHSSNRSRRGLYHGKDVRFGNTVSFSHRVHRRKFKPNVHVKRLWSETLERLCKFHITTHTLRIVDKYGGLDGYLLKTSDAKLNSSQGLAVKREIEEVLALRATATETTAAEGRETRSDGPGGAEAAWPQSESNARATSIAPP
ncbi:unnamed protein product [Phaeothamnion confervicola]